MKLRVNRVFKYTWDNVTTHTLQPGNYDVPKKVEERTALLAIQFGAAVWIHPGRKKAAPENKVVKKVSNKKKVSRKK